VEKTYSSCLSGTGWIILGSILAVLALVGGYFCFIRAEPSGTRHHSTAGVPVVVSDDVKTVAVEDDDDDDLEEATATSESPSSDDGSNDSINNN